MSKYTVIDVETANEDAASICQIGIVVFENGKIIDQWESLINPQTYFSWMNVDIHGIDEDTVKSAPTLQEVKSTLGTYLLNNVVLSHGHFDRVAISKALPDFTDIQWLDNTRVVRRAWEDCATSGYALWKICKKLKINIGQHHDALSDAIAAGKVFEAAMAHTGLGLEDWFKRIKLPLNLEKSVRPKNVENPEGVLFGETVIFTGSMSVSRVEIETLAIQNGAEVRSAITSKSTILVQGVQTASNLKGELSTKELKAKELISKGLKLNILSESDFYELLKISNE